jgi:hypothetical protein
VSVLPSKSFRKFETKLLVDVDRIIDSHAFLNHDGGGRRGLGHITRSGVLMLCAAWELYVEDALQESVEYFIDKYENPKDLPKPVKKELAKTVKESKHELKPLELAGEGWKSLYRNHVSEVLRGLNTPKSGNLDILFNRMIGVPRVSDWWSLGKDEIDHFVTMRGDVAHRGSDAKYVTIKKLKDYKGKVTQTTLDLDNELTEYLCRVTPGIERPWRRRKVNGE